MEQLILFNSKAPQAEFTNRADQYVIIQLEQYRRKFLLNSTFAIKVITILCGRVNLFLLSNGKMTAGV
jgi:hypothetical protein